MPDSQYNPSSPGGQISYQPQTGDNLTDFFRSTGNTLAGGGQAAQKLGTGLIGQGGGLIGQGGRTYEQGVQAIQPVLQHLLGIMTGDRSKILSEIGPQADAVSQQFGQIRQMIAGGPRGGGTASTLAQAPYQETQQLSGLVSKAQSDATQQLAGLGTAEAGLGAQEQGVGIAQQGVGAGVLSTGLQGLAQAMQGALAKFGVNVEGGFANQFKNIASGADSIAHALATII